MARQERVVATLSRVVPLMELQVSFSMNTNKVAQFSSMGGRAVLITFQSPEIRDEMIKGQWMNLWFSNVKPWKGEPACMERFAWLSCKGLPLSAWNATMFKKIAVLGLFHYVGRSDYQIPFLCWGEGANSYGGVESDR